MINAMFSHVATKYIMMRFTSLKLVLLSCLCMLSLSACQPGASSQAQTAAFQMVQKVDLLQLPNSQWQLSHDSLQISFCRNRYNEDLQAERGDLNRWRLVGDVSAFPNYRENGLEALAELYQDYDVLLWQQWGSFSSQIYRVAYPKGTAEPNIFNILARVGRDERICYSQLDQG